MLPRFEVKADAKVRLFFEPPKLLDKVFAKNEYFFLFIYTTHYSHLLNIYARIRMFDFPVGD